MNPYRQIALEHLSVKELEGVIAELKRRGSPEAMTEREMKINFYKKKLGII